MTTITLTPTVVSLGIRPWTNSMDSAWTTSAQGAALHARARMGVQLPDQSTITSLRITGQKDIALAPSPGELHVTLFRKEVTGWSDPELVVRVSNPPVRPTGLPLFDHTAPAPDEPVAEVDNDDFRYFLIAETDLDPSPHPISSSVALFAFQITCQEQ